MFQSLYSAIGSVSDHCLSSDVSVASGIAEYIDHIIRKEKSASWTCITISLSAVNLSAQLNELLFLYSNINAKDEFVNTYNSLLSRRLLFSRVHNLDMERNVISLIRSQCGCGDGVMISTGGLTVSTMDSILADISSNYSELI